MKKIIILLGIVIAFPLSAQSIFSGGQFSNYRNEKKVEKFITEAMYYDVTLSDHETRIAVVKRIEDSKVSYTIHFWGEDDISDYTVKNFNLNLHRI